QFAATNDMFDRFAELLHGAGARLGPVLFQFETIADVPQLADFLGAARARFGRVVAEFRHQSWFSPATYDVLAAADVPLCRTETDDGQAPVVTGPTFSYLRLRRSAYTVETLQARLAELGTLAGAHDVFAYMKHDVENAVLLRDVQAVGTAGS